MKKKVNLPHRLEKISITILSNGNRNQLNKLILWGLGIYWFDKREKA